MPAGRGLTRLASVVIIGAICGCADLYGVFTHVVGTPEAAPPLGEAFFGSFAPYGFASDGRPIPADINGGRPPNVNDVGGSYSVLRPAQNATAGDLAGTWVHAAGYGAMHIDEAGQVYQADVADSIGSHAVPEIVPRTLFNVGSASVMAEGRVDVEAGLSLFGLSAAASMGGTLDSTHNVIYGVISDMTVDRGDGPEHGTDYLPWLRWDPQAEAIARQGSGFGVQSLAATSAGMFGIPWDRRPSY
jgi:hypothetical protein